MKTNDEELRFNDYKKMYIYYCGGVRDTRTLYQDETLRKDFDIIRLDNSIFEVKAVRSFIDDDRKIEGVIYMLREVQDSRELEFDMFEIFNDLTDIEPEEYVYDPNKFKDADLFLKGIETED